LNLHQEKAVVFRGMAKKPHPKWDNPEESKRFLETAKAVEASEDPKDFERAFRKIVKPDKA
jgi:predicted RNA-binding Zn ribbon-like protein